VGFTPIDWEAVGHKKFFSILKRKSYWSRGAIALK
jgi:hypothetical protein